jgi:hypothetical protein
MTPETPDTPSTEALTPDEHGPCDYNGGPGSDQCPHGLFYQRRRVVRRWFHTYKDTPQYVEVLGWTQHGAIVLALEEGWLPTTEPVFVRMSELSFVHSDWIAETMA